MRHRHAAARLQELAHVDDDDVEAPRLEADGRPAAGQDGITIVVPTTTELAQNTGASSSSSTSGSGTSASITLRP